MGHGSDGAAQNQSCEEERVAWSPRQAPLGLPQIVPQ